MAAENPSVTTWLHLLKSGHSHAAEKIWQRYVEQLARHARGKLGVVRRAADEDDVVLSAFHAFLKGVEEGRFPRIDDRDDLWQILVMLTERRAIALRRKEHALKRGAGAVRGESVFMRPGDNGSHRPGLDAAKCPEATPAFAAEMAEQLQCLLTRLPDDTCRQIALGKLEGKTVGEISEELAVSHRTVERKLANIRKRWESEHTHE